MELKQYDAVRLKDGREAIVVEIFDDLCIVDVGDSPEILETIDVARTDIVEVIKKSAREIESDQDKAVIEQFQRRVAAPLKCIPITREEYNLYIEEKNKSIAQRKKKQMLEVILGKLKAETMEEFWERERRIEAEFSNKGMHAERKNPLFNLTDEERDFLRDNGYV